MARPLSKQELDRLAVDFPVSTKDEPYQTTSDRFKNVQTKRLTNPTREATERERRIAQNQEELEAFQTAAAYQETLALARARELEVATQLENSSQNQTSKNLASAAISAAKNTPAALWMTAWHTWFWLTFQVPLAFISLAFIGVQAAVDSTWIGQLLQRALGVINAAANLLGGDLSLMTPLNIALALHFLVFGLSLLCLLGTMMIYAIRGQNPLGGDRMAGKFGALLLCFIGYSTPLLNLLPWVGLYIYIMWRSKS